jgi:hypothetical protein
MSSGATSIVIGDFGRFTPSNVTDTTCAPTSGQHTVATARVLPGSSSRGTDMDMADGEMTRTEKASPPDITRPSSGSATSTAMSVYAPHTNGGFGGLTAKSFATSGP